MGTVEVDAFEFCRRKEARSGEADVASMARLATETLDSSGKLQWAVQGGADGRGHPLMQLQVQGDVKLHCQRCLAPMDFHIDSQVDVIIAADDASADVLDEQLLDEPVEVIVGSTAFDLLLLVEDEALLALPPAPRHEVCGAPAKPVDAPEKKESPFAVLGKLKR
ncbi:MAG: hypothetical protein JWP36_1811 [Paucimonas sp.]|nr:hypothetical protein [Paucimonas sp.]